MRIASSNSIYLFTALSSFHGFHVALIAYLNEVDLSMLSISVQGSVPAPSFFPSPSTALRPTPPRFRPRELSSYCFFQNRGFPRNPNTSSYPWTIFTPCSPWLSNT